MTVKAKLFILSMKGSPRLIFLKNRLKKLGIKNYKVFYGTNINIKDRKKRIKSDRLSQYNGNRMHL